MGGDGKWQGIQTQTNLVLGQYSKDNLISPSTHWVVGKQNKIMPRWHKPPRGLRVSLPLCLCISRPSTPPVNKHCSYKVTTSTLFRK